MDKKPGYKTTEFWLSTAAVLVGAALAVLESLKASGLEASWIQAALTGAGVISAALAAMGYTKGRSLLKTAQAQADGPAPNITVNPSPTQPPAN